MRYEYENHWRTKWTKNKQTCISRSSSQNCIRFRGSWRVSVPCPDYSAHHEVPEVIIGLVFKVKSWLYQVWSKQEVLHQHFSSSRAQQLSWNSNALLRETSYRKWANFIAKTSTSWVTVIPQRITNSWWWIGNLRIKKNKLENTRG